METLLFKCTKKNMACHTEFIFADVLRGNIDIELLDFSEMYMNPLKI